MASDDDGDDDDQPRVVSPPRVALLGAMLLAVGASGFYHLPGMIQEDAQGSRAVNSIYCSVMTLTTIGFGDICPGELEPISKLFLVVFALSGLGFFCGPILDLFSSWKHRVPAGGFVTLASLTIGMGVTLFTSLEGKSQSEAVYASVIAGTTIGYGDITPATDMGKLAVAAYAVLVCGVVGALLQPGREFLESLCRVKPKPPLEKKVAFSNDTRSPSSSPAKSARKITSGSYQEVTEFEPKIELKKEL